MREAPTILALFSIVAFFVIAVLLLLSNRGKTGPVESALRTLAAQTSGVYRRKFVGAGQMVEFSQGGRHFTFEVASSLAGSGDAMASHLRLRASVPFQPIQPFELVLDPKAVREIVIRLKKTAAVDTLLDIPPIDDVYRVRTSDPQMAVALLSDAVLQRQLAAVAKHTSRLAIGPHNNRAWIAFGEDEEQVSGERLLAIRDLLATFLTALERYGVAVLVQ